MNRLFVDCTLLTVVLLLLPLHLRGQELRAGLEAGPHPVGFTTIGVRDSSRPMPDAGPRPVQISLWYPARAPDDGHPEAPYLSYGDYFLLTASEVTLEEPSARGTRTAVEDFKAFLASNGVGEAAVDDWLSRRMTARRDLPAAPGRFPLVLIAQGNFHSAYNQAILAEYLASHGYLVATSPSQSRIDGPPAQDEPPILAARAQAGDMKVVLRTLDDDARVAPGPPGIVAHSFGARSAFLVLLEREIGALVSLDGGIANRLGKGWLDAVTFDRTTVSTPILHFYQEVDEVVQPDFELLESLSSSDRLLVKVDSLYHPHFTSLGPVSGLIPGLEVGPPSPDVVAKSAAIARVTRRFLDGHLKMKGGPPGESEVEALGGGSLSARHLTPSEPDSMK